MAKSDYEDLTEANGFTPNEDVELDGIGNMIFDDELEFIQYDLLEDYGLNFTFDDILEYLEEFNIDLFTEGNYTVADLIYMEINKEL